MRLVADGDGPYAKTEIRLRGPHVMAGYWREPALSAEAFDEAGFYRTGDALRWVDAADPQAGLLFDGRIAEDFKLDTGTFVSVGPLRARVMGAGDTLVQDVVLPGLNRSEVGALLLPRLDECRKFPIDKGEITDVRERQRRLRAQGPPDHHHRGHTVADHAGRAFAGDQQHPQQHPQQRELVGQRHVGMQLAQ